MYVKPFHGRPTPVNWFGTLRTHSYCIVLKNALSRRSNGHSRFESQYYSCLDTSHADKGPCPHRAWCVHLLAGLDSACGSRIFFSLTETTSVGLISSIQSLASQEGSSCLVAVRSEDSWRVIHKTGAALATTSLSGEEQSFGCR